MEKEIGQVKITETDDGYRVDVKGKNAKAMMACCGPMMIRGWKEMADCCPDGKSASAECCPDETDKK